MPATVLGIDPGKDGALVVLTDVGLGRLKCIRQILTSDLCPDAYIPERMDDAVSAAVSELGVDLAVLERVNTRPGEGRSSAFNFGAGWGLWRGILAGRVRVIEPTPVAWTKALLRDVPGEGKDRTIAWAAQVLDLNLSPGRKRVPHSGLADAAGLAAYGILRGAR